MDIYRIHSFPLKLLFFPSTEMQRKNWMISDSTLLLVKVSEIFCLFFKISWFPVLLMDNNSFNLLFFSPELFTSHSFLFLFSLIDHLICRKRFQPRTVTLHYLLIFLIISGLFPLLVCYTYCYPCEQINNLSELCSNIALHFFGSSYIYL